MTNAFQRTSENALFTLLIAVFVGSLAISAATDLSKHSAAVATSTLARVAVSGSNS
ncbi:MAG: hypothetical protein JO133_01940 [Burkholderiaceae bacterium]|nr:hypothetical protein [Burkholderiaceae bacterium]